MVNLKDMSEFLNESNSYLNKKMPPEFMEICKTGKFDSKIVSRNDNPFRLFNIMKNYVDNNYTGGLGQDLASIAKKIYNNNEEIVDIFRMREDEYKEKHPKKYNSFFNDLPFNERVKSFVCADYGARSVFECKQDTFAGNLYEDMLVYHSSESLKTNPDATGRNTNNISTNPDLIFKDEKNSVALEIKTKWSGRIYDNINIIEFRGKGYDNLKLNKGICLTTFPRLNKTVLIDTTDNYKETKTNMSNSNKECTRISFNMNDLFKFKLGDEENMKEMLKKISDKIKSRDK